MVLIWLRHRFCCFPMWHVPQLCSSQTQQLAEIQRTDACRSKRAALALDYLDSPTSSTVMYQDPWLNISIGIHGIGSIIEWQTMHRCFGILSVTWTGRQFHFFNQGRRLCMDGLGMIYDGCLVAVFNHVCCSTMFVMMMMMWQSDKHIQYTW